MYICSILVSFNCVYIQNNVYFQKEMFLNLEEKKLFIVGQYCWVGWGIQFMVYNGFKYFQQGVIEKEYYLLNFQLE